MSLVCGQSHSGMTQRLFEECSHTHTHTTASSRDIVRVGLVTEAMGWEGEGYAERERERERGWRGSGTAKNCRLSLFWIDRKLAN